MYVPINITNHSTKDRQLCTKPTQSRNAGWLELVCYNADYDYELILQRNVKENPKVKLYVMLGVPIHVLSRELPVCTKNNNSLKCGIGNSKKKYFCHFLPLFSYANLHRSFSYLHSNNWLETLLQYLGVLKIPPPPPSLQQYYRLLQKEHKSQPSSKTWDTCSEFWCGLSWGGCSQSLYYILYH